MPRSVNAVASRARRKKVLKQAKGYFGRRKNVHTVAKMLLKKDFNTVTETEGLKREISGRYGFSASMLLCVRMIYLIQNSSTC
jgi:hypothetical protein